MTEETGQLVKKIEAVMLQLSEMSESARRLDPESAAYYRINAAWRKLEEAFDLLTERKPR